MSDVATRVLLAVVLSTLETDAVDVNSGPTPLTQATKSGKYDKVNKP